jgi:glyoxylase-like metal-dependent hydrolase (beta-lactamase superfamily II)
MPHAARAIAHPHIFVLVGLLCAIAPAGRALAQAVEFKLERAADQVYMLRGQGGNIGVCVGDDGVFAIDDQFAPLTPRILEEIEKLSEKPVRFVVNTHWHGDHTGGNENLGKAGAIIVAHANVRKRMSEKQFMEAFNRTVEPAPKGALPVVTFDQSITFHWNDETIEVVHVEPAHTDGDSFVHFRSANVLHAGDVFFNGMYPFIDTSTGGNLEGVIRAVERILERSDAKTRIIPGHGPLASRADLERYQAMLTTARDRIEPLLRAGRSRDEVIAAKPTADLDADWGGGFMKPDVWVGIVYDGIQRAPR